MLLNHVPASQWPAWDVVVGDEAVHHLPVEATPDEAKAATEVWLRERFGDGDDATVVWEPTGDDAYLGRWVSPP